jgi:ATP-dependent Clp protease ATP-binding subunit ClpX
LIFEQRLPSTQVHRLAITPEVLGAPGKWLRELESTPDHPGNLKAFDEISNKEIASVAQYIETNKRHLSDKFGLPLTSSRIELIASYYSRNIINIEGAMKKMAFRYEQIKAIEMNFLKNHGINIVLEEDTIDHIIGQWLVQPVDCDAVYKQLSTDFLLGLKLVHEKTGRNRFFITHQALEAPEDFIRRLLQKGPAEA